jgi:hypothetical protein
MGKYRALVLLALFFETKQHCLSYIYAYHQQRKYYLFFLKIASFNSAVLISKQFNSREFDHHRNNVLHNMMMDTV